MYSLGSLPRDRVGTLILQLCVELVENALPRTEWDDRGAFSICHVYDAVRTVLAGL